jgi:hypothetical protein
MEVIYGPTAPSVGRVIYQVTLASGVIVTNPDGFGVAHQEAERHEAVVSERGRVLRRERRDMPEATLPT